MPQQLDKNLLHQYIINSLAEDVGSGDHTSLACIPADKVSSGYLLVKDVGVICGLEVATAVFEYLDPNHKMQIHIPDGTDVEEGDIVFDVEANARAFLKGERLILNTMQRLSGICTQSSRYAVEVEDLPVTVLDTRKTTPGMRFLEKYAVRVGGCSNYRDGLYDWIMIKDNHIDACGGITAAIDAVHAYFHKTGMTLGITVEVRNLVELHEVLERGGVTRIMLDNFNIPILKEGVATVDGRFETEASGGIDLTTIRSYAETGVNFISVGALTHSARSKDLSLKVRK